MGEKLLTRSMKDGSKEPPEENDTQTESHHPLRIKGSILHREDGLMTYKKKTLSLKYVIINHMYYDELQKQLNAGFHKQNS